MMNMKRLDWKCAVRLAAGLTVGGIPAGQGLRAAQHVYLTDVPDYEWHAGCFGTATGNLMGFWDRHGFPDFYTGPTAGGEAPLTSQSPHRGIQALWASRAGRDGRPADQPGHEDDYYVDYESTAPDPHVTAGREEHAPDCLGDFIGLSQKKWQDLGGECDGNVDGYCFTYWDPTGARRVNYEPGPEAGLPAVDLASGLRAWTAWRGFEAEVFTQLADFNPQVAPGAGFTYADLRAEIDAGYPVLVWLQNYEETSRPLYEMPRANPNLHGMLIHGYYVDDAGTERVYVRNSWGDSQWDMFREWKRVTWTPTLPVYLPVRGVIGYHPKPRLTDYERVGDALVLRWQGPSAQLHDVEAGTTRDLHWYVVEVRATVDAGEFVSVTEPAAVREATVPLLTEAAGFYRVRLVPPPAE
jgi:hypothetical protein